MKIKHSVITGFLGRQVDRFTEYQPARTFAEKLALAQQVQGLQGLEVVYPIDFTEGIEQTIKVLRDSGLGISAVNLNLKQDTIIMENMILIFGLILKMIKKL